MARGCAHLQPLDPAFEEHEEGGVGIGGLSLPQDGLGLHQAGLRVGAVQGEEGLHYRVVPQEGQAGDETPRVTNHVLDSLSCSAGCLGVIRAVSHQHPARFFFSPPL